MFGGRKYLIVTHDDFNEGYRRDEMRENMRRGRGMHSSEQAYREGYRHGWEDSEDDMSEGNFRRMRDYHGRFI